MKKITKPKKNHTGGHKPNPKIVIKIKADSFLPNVEKLL